MLSSKWIVRTKTQAQFRIFCFPYAGGGASIYRPWFDQFPPTIEICPVQLPGRENRITEDAETNLSSLLEELTLALHPHLDLPFAFFGHSLGALIAFELTRHLRKKHLPQPSLLFLSAHRAPNLPLRAQKLHMMNNGEFKEALKTLGGTPEAVLQHEELMDMLLPMLRADFTIYETYSYHEEAPLHCPMHIYGGDNDNEVMPEELQDWSLQTQALCSIKIFAGGHFFLHERQQQLLQDMSQVLATHLTKR